MSLTRPGSVLRQAPPRVGSCVYTGRLFFFSSRRRHTRFDCDWSSDVCSSDLTSSLTRLVRSSRRVTFVPLGLVVASHSYGMGISEKPAVSIFRVNIALVRSEEHTSELQSQSNLVCRLLLEKKKFSYPIVYSAV